MVLLVATILASLVGAAILGLAWRPRDRDPQLQASKQHAARIAWGIVFAFALSLFLAFWFLIEVLRHFPSQN
jgi:hypothetical protein